MTITEILDLIAPQFEEFTDNFSYQSNVISFEYDDVKYLIKQVNSLIELFKNGKLVGMVVSDGDLVSLELNPNDCNEDILDEFVSNVINYVEGEFDFC